MPVIELDMLIALVNKADKLHETSKKLFQKISSGKITNVKVTSSAYLEYELVLKSRGYSLTDIYSDLQAFRYIKNLGEAPLTVNIIVRAIELRRKYNISYFDSLHAATAIEYDKIIISTDHIYKEIKELKYIPPEKI
ncbi:MAG TPA: type II toxin-antitoxin system VapC family toxin [Thermoprotei archaeon]|nr:type II toxin-antitoxin system VapC family toxin [Thermoprotei archaeon]